MSDGKTGAGEFSLAGWRVLLADLGISHLNVLRRARLPDDLLAMDAPRVGPREFYRLWDALVEEADDPRLPLRIAEALSPEVFDPAIFAAMSSPDLNTALERIAHYKRLVAPMRLHVRREPTYTRLDIELPQILGEAPPALVACELLFFLNLARVCTRARVQPLEVSSGSTRLEPAHEYREVFGAPIEPGESIGLTFSAGDAARPFLTANQPMWAFFEPQLRKRLAELDASASTEQRVRAALLELLPSGLASTDEVARRLGMSKRTLQRRLQADGTSFQRLLDETREQLARHYLERSDMSGAEISFLLGFEDPNSFFRAFHGWTGQTPERVRAELRPGG